MNSVRRATARRMSATWASVPQVTNTDQADITELEQSRQRNAERVEQAGGKLTITALLLKLLGLALKEFPKINASLDLSSQEIVHKQYYHVGVAVDTERGLLVPVIRDVDRKGLQELCVELNQVAERARNRSITMEEMQGGSFTITNLGSIGGGHFTPIVNTPEVAVLGVSRSRIEAVWRDGQFQPRLILPLSLSYDHRLIDGADAARFLKRLVEMLEDPLALSFYP
jgi:pyruvate dehydrogenase E2 component (dihydrolipoamide acetyltransferase)